MKQIPLESLVDPYRVNDLTDIFRYMAANISTEPCSSVLYTGLTTNTAVLSSIRSSKPMCHRVSLLLYLTYITLVT